FHSGVLIQTHPRGPEFARAQCTPDVVELATRSGFAPLSPLRQSGCATRRITGQKMAADLRLERSASGLTVRFPHPVGLSAKEKIGAECGNRTRLICLEGRGPKPLDQPRTNG